MSTEFQVLRFLQTLEDRLPPHMPEIQERYDFANGWSIVVHKVKASQVYFQRWPPGVNRQSFIANCARMPIPAFVSAINQQIVLESSPNA